MSIRLVHGGLVRTLAALFDFSERKPSPQVLIPHSCLVRLQNLRSSRLVGALACL